MVAYEYDRGAYWTICSFYGWYTVIMVGEGQFTTFSNATH